MPRAIHVLPLLVLAIGLMAAESPLTDPAAIPESEYVRVAPDGHLTWRGQRARFWSIIGNFPNVPDFTDGGDRAVLAARVQADNVALVRRFADLGFNSVRLWSALTDDYTPGDGSQEDAVDHLVATLGRAGMRIWCAGLNGVGDAKPEDAGIIEDPVTAQAWAEAVRSGEDGCMEIRNHLARIWDPRLQALAVQRMTAIATHRNRHTGLRWCDDPTFAVWELSNEEWWISRMVSGQWTKLPPFFRQQLISHWNGFLTTKYGSTDALLGAWGRLQPGEDLTGRTILFAPMAQPLPSGALVIPDAGAHALAALQANPTDLGPGDLPEARGRDVLEFLTGLLIAHKQREVAALRPLGRSTSLCPWLFDTGIGYQIQSQFLHQHADAVAHDAYVNGVGESPGAARPEASHAGMLWDLEQERLTPNRGRWINWLEKPPSISHGVPWLEHNRVAGKPYFCYETQIMQPAKYRADFPLRIAALAAIQDWDWICWHYWGAVRDITTADEPFTKPMDVTVDGHPQGYHFTYDEVQAASMRAAAELFVHGLIPPAPQPTTFTFGRRSLYDPASMTYGHSYGRLGLDMLPTTYQHGMRLRIDPTREDDAVEGPRVSFDTWATHNPYAAGNGVVFDWKAGHLRMESDKALVFAGFVRPEHDRKIRFAGGSVEDLSWSTPAGAYDPVTADEGYCAISIVSADGKPLTHCARATVVAVSTSYNTGFALADPGVEDAPNTPGTLPVLANRIGATLRVPALAGMRWTLRDWHMRPLGEGAVGTDGMLRIPGDRAVFLVELTR